MRKLIFILSLVLFTLNVSSQTPIQNMQMVISTSAQVVSSPYGVELVTNGNFSVGTGWTLSTGTTISGGECVINSAITYYNILYQAVGITVGKTYKIEFDITAYTSGTIRVQLGNVDTGTDTYDVSFVAVQHVNITIPFTDTTTDARLSFYSWGTAPVMHIDNVSLKEVL
jgi:hypothetical protein